VTGAKLDRFADLTGPDGGRELEPKNVVFLTKSGPLAIRRLAMDRMPLTLERLFVSAEREAEEVSTKRTDARFVVDAFLGPWRDMERRDGAVT